MRKLAMCLLGCALAAFVLPSISTANNVSVSAFGGAGIPTGTFGNDNYVYGAKVGYQFGGNVDYHMGSWVAGLDGSYNKAKGVLEGQTESVQTVAKAEHNYFQVGIHGRYMIPVQGPVHPYAMLGLGGYKFHYKETDTEPGVPDASFEIESKAGVGFKFGAGADWAINHVWGICGELNYNLVPMDDKRDFRVSSLQYVGLTAGVTWSMGSGAAAK